MYKSRLTKVRTLLKEKKVVSKEMGRPILGYKLLEEAFKAYISTSSVR
jgi:hypothetical protein